MSKISLFFFFLRIIIVKKKNELHNFNKKPFFLNFKVKKRISPPQTLFIYIHAEPSEKLTFFY